MNIQKIEIGTKYTIKGPIELININIENSNTIFEVQNLNTIFEVHYCIINNEEFQNNINNIIEINKKYQSDIDLIIHDTSITRESGKEKINCYLNSN